MKTWTLLLLPLLFACAGAHAQQVIYTCAGKAGTHVLQDRPCADSGTRQIAARSYQAPREAPGNARRLEAIDREMHAQWAADRDALQPRYKSRASVARRGMETSAAGRRALQRERCETARAQVDAASRSRHPRRDRGQLEDEAVDACFAL